MAMISAFMVKMVCEYMNPDGGCLNTDDVMAAQTVKNMLIINSFYLPRQPIVCKLHLYFYKSTNTCLLFHEYSNIG